MAKEKTVEELQRELIQTQLETAKITLEQQREANLTYKERKARAKKANEIRQAEFSRQRLTIRAIQMGCAHLSGGEPTDPVTEGGGKFSFSVLTRVIMPDGKTVWVNCPRCRLKLYGRHRTKQEEARMAAAAEKGDPVAVAAWEDHQWWKQLMVTSKKDGIPHNEIRGVTFNFEKNGTNFIPDITGWVSSGMVA